VHREGGYDFRDYKHGTVVRRLERRLCATGVGTYRDYMLFLDEHPEEYQKLAEDLTIKTSGFFRSQHTFQKVAGLVLPELVSRKRERGERSLRFWSAACARGEEPYSIAILLAEFLGQRHDFAVLIYASDVSRQALQDAQAGKYSVESVKGLSEAIRRKYFIRCGEGYQVGSDIRRMVSFQRFDLASTIPQSFGNPDCIFCCNVLIYLQRQLQERVLGRLYGSLASPGYLVLGEVETPAGNLHGKLECLDSRAKIYRKNGGG